MYAYSDRSAAAYVRGNTTRNLARSWYASQNGVPYFQVGADRYSE